MGLFNPFYYFNYFIKCFIRVFTKKFFKIIIFLLIILLISLFYFKCYGFSSSDLVYNDNDFNNLWYDWLYNTNEYNSGNYYYCMGIAYDGVDSPNNRRVPFLTFINKSDFDDNCKAYWDNRVSSYQDLFWLFFTKQVQVVQYLNLSTTPFGNGFVSNTQYGWGPYPGTTNFWFKSTLPKIYADQNLTTISYPPQTNPYFETSSSDLSTFNFDYFTINGGTMPYKNTIEGIEYTAELTLDYTYKGVRTIIPIDNYLQVNDNLWTINIPYNVINNNVIVKNGETFYYRLNYSLYGTNYSGGISISGTYNLTTEQENNINEEGNKQLLNQLQANQNMTNQKLDQQTNAINNQTNAINNQTQKIDDLNDNINDSNVDDINQDSLPSDSSNDITKDGVNGIFTSIYNAFCTGEPVNIDFPIPNTNKFISLSPLYVYDSLSNFGGGFLVMLIQAFWWYLISRFIIKDIVNKINKIKSGNIENIETSNIRGDML